MKLRPYQQESVERTLAGFQEFDKQLLVLPTGGGKTIVFSHLAAALQPKKTLILAHREELIDQAIAKLYAATGIVAQKEKASFRASLRAPVVVASVQSMVRRLDFWPAQQFGLVVADEAHHAVSDSWQRVLNHFDPVAKVLGVTATPDRGDKRNLGSYFENVAHEVQLFELVNAGFLSRIVCKSIPLQIDLAGVRSTAGDFNDADLGGVLAPYLDAIADQLAAHAFFRKTLVFLPLIATSKAFAACLEERGFRVDHVDGQDPERAEKLARFGRGETDVLCNAMLLTEGYDEPATDCVVVLRPTRSRGLYSQMVGRGTRISEGKQNLLLLDFLWMHERHNLIRPANLVASSDQQAADITTLIEEREAGGDQDELDLEGLVGEAQQKREAKLREELAQRASRKAKEFDAIDWALSMGAHDVVDYEPAMKWEEQPVSEGQAGVLRRAGFDLETITCRGMASKLIDLVITRSKLNLCTAKQMRMLAKLGHPNPASATFAEARSFLDSHLGGRRKRQPENAPF